MSPTADEDFRQDVAFPLNDDVDLWNHGRLHVAVLEAVDVDPLLVGDHHRDAVDPGVRHHVADPHLVAPLQDDHDPLDDPDHLKDLHDDHDRRQDDDVTHHPRVHPHLIEIFPLINCT